MDRGGVGDKGNSGSRITPCFDMIKQADGVCFAGMVKIRGKQMESKNRVLFSSW